MTPQDIIRFENYVRHCGYSTRKEGGRYCHGIVNLLKDAWFTAQKEARPAPVMAAQDLNQWAKGERTTHRLLTTEH